MKPYLKKKLKSYSFWLSILSALFLVVQLVGKPLGFVISEESYMSIINSILGILTVFGIISKPSVEDNINSSEENKSENENNNIEK